MTLLPSTSPTTICLLKCPVCGHVSTETMPTDACIYFYDCGACGCTLRPKSGDCCVFCSYGTIPCPPVQAAKGCRCAGVI